MLTIGIKDIIQVVKLSVLLPVSWFLPTRYWPLFTLWLGKIHIRLMGGKADRLENVVQDQLGINPADLEIGYRQNDYWELLEILREYAPWGWKPKIKVVGQEFIDDALAKGKGAVLWYCPFARADVVFKKGLYQAGYRLNHLSSFSHGFSKTRFGLALLNPVKTRVESRYLKERCVIGLRDVGIVIRSLLDRLRANEVVSVTALETGKHFGERKLLGGTVRLAKGAPNFALTTGAALIPVFVVPVHDGFEVRIEPPLVASSAELEVAEEEYISAYIPVLGRYVTMHPYLWHGWLGLPNYWKPDEPTTQNDKKFMHVA